MAGHTGLLFHYAIADPKVVNHIFKQNTLNAIFFQVTTDLLNSENLRIAITQLCHELHISNFTML